MDGFLFTYILYLGFAVLVWTWIDRHVTIKRIHIHHITTSNQKQQPKDSYGVRELRDGYQMRDLAEVNPDATLSGVVTPLFSSLCPTSYNIPLFRPTFSLPTPPVDFVGSSCFLPTPSLSLLFCNSQDEPNSLSLLRSPFRVLEDHPLSSPSQSHLTVLDALSSLPDRI